MQTWQIEIVKLRHGVTELVIHENEGLAFAGLGRGKAELRRTREEEDSKPRRRPETTLFTLAY